MRLEKLRNPVRYARKSQNLISGGTSHEISGLIHVGSGFSEPCWTLYYCGSLSYLRHTALPMITEMNLRYGGFGFMSSQNCIVNLSKNMIIYQ